MSILLEISYSELLQRNVDESKTQCANKEKVVKSVQKFERSRLQLFKALSDFENITDEKNQTCSDRQEDDFYDESDPHRKERASDFFASDVVPRVYVDKDEGQEDLSVEHVDPILNDPKIVHSIIFFRTRECESDLQRQ